MKMCDIIIVILKSSIIINMGLNVKKLFNFFLQLEKMYIKLDISKYVVFT